MRLSTSIMHPNLRHSAKYWLVVILLLKACPFASAQDTVDLPLYEEWDTYSATSNRNVNGWFFCKNGIGDESIVQRGNLHAFLSTGSSAGSGTVVATPYLSQVPDTFSFRLYGSSLKSHTALVEFGFIPDTPPIGTASDICELFVPYDTVPVSISNQWLRTTVDLHPYFAIHGYAHRFAIRLLNSYSQELYLDEVGAWKGKGPCPTETDEGSDFWVTFIPNINQQEAQFSLLVTGLDDAVVSIGNPLTGWSTTTNHIGGTKTHIPLPMVSSIPSASPSTVGFHVSSTADISLFASNYIATSWDVCSVIPTDHLTSQYIVQDYPSNSNYTGGMALVAVEDGTSLTMTLPCVVNGLSQPAGSTYNITLNAGQSLALTCGTNQSFCGMTVTSNDKPFALFQGHSGGRVGTDDSLRSRDHMVEQAIPLDWWGKEFVVLSEQNRTEGDRIRITAGANNCHIFIQETSGNVNVTLNTGQTHEYHLPAHSVAYITADQPVYVCKYLISFDEGNLSSLGDPASVTIPPVHNWICSTTFPVHNCNTNPTNQSYITDGHHYFDLVTTTTAVSAMQLDGLPLPATGFTNLAGTPYSYYHGAVAPGAHTLSNSDGPFYATVSGHGRWVGYAFLTGCALEPQPPDTPQIHDTVEYRDTVCQNGTYQNHGFTIGSTETTASGTLDRWRSTTLGNITHHYHLLLTILPLSHGDTVAYLILGDTLFFQGDTLTQAGSYLYILTGANGCDSLLTLYVNWEEVRLTVSANGICPGDSVTLTATGTQTAFWSATPPDPSLDSQQGQTVVTVSPRQTTVYNLYSYEGGPPAASVTVGVGEAPHLCFEQNRPFIDFDYPVMLFTDCSEGCDHTTWIFSDGITLNATKARRQFHHPLPDSVEVTLRSCNQWNCCADTTFIIKPFIRSVWFPNVFSPGEETNNRFGVTASFEIVDFELYIYNRQGMLMYKTTDPAAPWDGTHDGVPCPQGAYAYYWHVRDAVDYNQTDAGIVTLLR